MKSYFLQQLQEKVLVIDGAMGTLLMEAGIEVGECFEEVNLTKPQIVKSIHQAYLDAGADIIETNTFSANRFKLSEYNLADKITEINLAAAGIAKAAAKDKAYVAGSVGPLGKLVEPVGEVSFEQAYEIFKEQMSALEKGGVDLLSLETISDLAEMRAALIAAKENTSLPIITSLTYEEGFTLTGTPPEVAATVLTSLGSNLISANCSSGPEGMREIAKKFLKYSNLPVMIMPNAGLPQLKNDKTVYKMTPVEFAKHLKKLVDLGVSIVGGCCGTTPAHIAALRKMVDGSKKVQNKFYQPGSRLASRTKLLENKFIKIGERINPTARKILSAELKNGLMKTLRFEAKEQTKNKADLLDINIGVPEIDEEKIMKKAVQTVQSVSALPLSIDSPNPKTLEAGLKACIGKALINSVNGEAKSLKAVLPLAKKYGAALIGLTLDEKGIPLKAEARLKVAKKIVAEAEKSGIPREDIFIDTLVLSAGAQQKEVMETIKALKLVKEKLGVKTSLGISNVSHGLPNRKLLNETFLSLAIEAGLDAAIVNPSLQPKKNRLAEDVLTGKDLGCREYIRQESNLRYPPPTAQFQKNIEGSLGEIKEAIIEGNKDLILEIIEKALGKHKPQEIIDKGLLPGMEIVGSKFSKGEYFIPQVMDSAKTMKLGFERVKKEIPADETKTSGTAVIATVKGDIHDIGKNIVALMLENSGFKIIDLGKDVPAEVILETVKKEKANLVLLSALLTTTMPYMKVVKEKLAQAGLNIPLMVGGAAVTQEYATKINANFSKDAVEAVRVAKSKRLI